MDRSTSTGGCHRRQRKVPFNLFHLLAHRELVTSMPVHQPGKETIYIYCYVYTEYRYIDTEYKISEKAWNSRVNLFTPLNYSGLLCPSNIVVHISAMSQWGTNQSLQYWVSKWLSLRLVKVPQFVCSLYPMADSYPKAPGSFSAVEPTLPYLALCSEAFKILVLTFSSMMHFEHGMR